MRRVVLGVLLACALVVGLLGVAAADNPQVNMRLGDSAVIRFGGNAGQVDVSRSGYRYNVLIGPDVRVVLRERDGDIRTELVHGTDEPSSKLVIWHAAGTTARVTSPDGTVRVDVEPGDGGSTTTTTVDPSTTTTTADDGGAVVAGSGWVTAGPDDSEAGPRTPYATPFKASAKQHRDIGFSVGCPYSHSLRDDPIVFPRRPGASHLHDFMGAMGVNAETTANSLLRMDTTCSSTDDRTGYWFPTMYDNGKKLMPFQTTFYYKPGVEARATIKPIPLGLRMIAGNTSESTKPPSRFVGWIEEHRNVSNRTREDSKQMITARETGKIILRIVFPDCWDGRHLDSPDHRSHMAYHVVKTKKCPSSHPVPVPQVTTFVTYNTRGGAGISLASGPWWTMHADFFNAWHPETQKALINECIVPQVRCGRIKDR